MLCKAGDMSGSRVFVSHSHQDAVFTKRLVADLAAGGADVWVDVDEIEHGDFQEHINQALVGCQWYVLVLSPEAIHSNWVRMETNAAIQRKMAGQLKEILPVVARPIDPATIPPTWDTFQRFDATRDYQSALQGVVRALGLRMPMAQPMAQMAQSLAAQPAQPGLGANPGMTLREHQPRPRWIRSVTAIVTVLLLVIVVVVLVKSSPNLFSASVATPVATTAPGDPTPTAKQWQPVIQAIQAYCAAVVARNYVQAYQMLSQEQTSYWTEQEFTDGMKIHDAENGVMTSCAPRHNASVDRFPSNTLAIYSATVQRRKGSPITGAIEFVQEHGTWKVGEPEQALTLV